MKALFKERRIFLMGGPGGVGKTTCAAALGVKLAREGHRTVVLTVDPAHRLAQALGFEHFSSELEPVHLPDKPDAVLFASMLDTQRYFDKVIARFATSEAQREKILNNRFYRVMVESLGGSHEYAAMERLLEFAKDTRFDKIVVDTPPTQNALDLLSAPQRLADFMDNSVLKWFQGPKPYYLALFRQGTKLVMKMLHKVFGSEFLESLGEALGDLEGMQAGFRRRNLEVLDLLKSQSTGFFLVTTPTEVRYLESLEFLKTLRNQGIPLGEIVLNRLEREPPIRDASFSSVPSELAPLFEYFQALYDEQQGWVRRFEEAAPEIPFTLIPKQTEEIHDVSVLSQLGSLLVD